MLNRRIRKAAAAARPVKASGVAAISVWPRAPGDRNAASKIWREACGASWPVASSTMPEAKKAKTIEPAGTAKSSQRGCSRRRSIRTRIPSPGHLEPDPLEARRLGRELAADPALVDHRDAVGEREN